MATKASRCLRRRLLAGRNKSTSPHHRKDDPVNPQHYAGLTIEPIDVIEAWNLGFHLGNTVKYIVRAGHKTPDALVDLKKGRWYLDRKIALLEKK